MNQQLESFLDYQRSEGRHLGIVVYEENVILSVPFDAATLKGLSIEFELVEENRDEREMV